MDLTPPRSPLCELFIVLEPFRAGFESFMDALDPLDTAAAEGPFLKSSDVFYRPDTDIALLALRFDERSTTPQKLLWLGEVAARADLPVLDPGRLGAADRRAFYENYLPTYRIRVEASAGPRDALEELARVLSLRGAPAPTPSPPPRTPAGTQRRAPQGTEPSRRAERQATVPSAPHARFAADGAASGPRYPRPGSKPPQVRIVEPPRRAQTEPGKNIHVRFLRGDTWVPARLRALNLRGARLAAAAPPRRGDVVQIVIGLDRVGAVVTGVVTEVIGATEAADLRESTGFAVEFPALDESTRVQLTNVLRRAVQAGISLKPPPARAEVRFPVHWPMRILTSWGELGAAALDVSKSGLFVAPSQPITRQDLLFQMSLDQGGTPLSGRAQVAREVSDEMATERGLQRGYGVRILDFSTEDSARYQGFLDRVRRRTEKRLLVAAEGTRPVDLSRGLGAAGYTVHSSIDAHGLLTRLEADPRPPDAALVHTSLFDHDPNGPRLRRALHARHVPCLTIGDEPTDRTRVVVDHLLHIA